MKEIILKAIEGGWKPHFWDAGDTNQLTAEYIIDNPYETFCDPKFFQALGKACGWGYKLGKGKLKIDNPDTKEQEEIAKEWGIKPDWVQYSLRFHEINLTSGWDAAITYLSALTKTK